MSDRTVVWLTGITCTTLLALVLGIFAMANWRTKIFVENGYTRQTIQSQSSVEWVKTK
jgi:hypothetical protein